ncbi:DMT family transporter [Rickettsiales bacterium]|nr:DMT family transporter [Rickettsiales bacterium]
MENINNRQIVGIGWMVLHCFLISAMSAMIKNISEEFHVLQIAFTHNFVAFILMFPVILTGNRYKNLKTKKVHLHILRAFLGAISLAMYFYAFTVMPLTQARAIALTGPLVSSLFAVLFLNEKMGWYRISALIIGFVGALVILRPGTDSFTYVSLMVISSVFMWAIIDIIIKTLGKTESTSSQLFYLTGLMSLFTLPGAVYFWKTPENYEQIVILFLLGAIFVVNVAAVFNAFKNADVTVIMPFDFSGMVFTTIIAYLIFSEIIDFYTAVGSMIIVVSSVYIARREAKIDHKVHAVIPKSEI